MSLMTDADMADDEANYVMTEYEQGRAGDNVVAEAEYPCGCLAPKKSRRWPAGSGSMDPIATIRRIGGVRRPNVIPSLSRDRRQAR